VPESAAPAVAVPVIAVRAVTAAVASHDVLLEHADARHPLVALRRDDGIIGIGELLRLEFTGADRLTDAAAAWRRIAAAADVVDDVHLAGCGLVAFGTFAFADTSSAASVLVVPRLVVGRRDGVSWVTRISLRDDPEEAEVAEPQPIGERPRATLAAASLSREGFTAVVGSAVQAIREGRVEKVVIARDATASIPPDADRRALLSELADRYPDCLTFAVDGLIGASPETLVSVHAHEASARVLAGSTARGAGSADDAAAAATLATSQKDLDEHAFAVRSVLDALHPHVRAITASELPFTLKLPNLWHLATDIEMQLGDGASALDLVAALHPTAAVAGSPRDAALELIAELEPFDRGRYAGPVGWIDQDGDGEWVIALRCARIDDDGLLTAYAGAGIVIDSDPDSELAETRMKFRPIADALR
jgi:menaquinone-specific isochorismate synthase